MVKVIMGLSGTGKTKQLIDCINGAIETESGSMVCIEKGNKLTFDIDYRVRLIEAGEYEMGSFTFLKGFISGIHAGNFDVTHIFVKNLYKITGSDSKEEMEQFLAWCEAFGSANNMKFTVVITDDPDAATEGVSKYF